MADTQRTRAQILALMADNVTGQISAQDVRDFIVTVMEEEFANPGDFWAKPDAKLTNTDKSARGWKLYSQFVGSNVVWREVLYQDQSTGVWYRADAADSTKQGLLGMAMDTYGANTSQATILLDGMVYDTSLSAVFSRKIGRPVYLDSGTPGSLTASAPALSAWSEVVILGAVMYSTTFSITSADCKTANFYFRPQWAVKGT
jgi:hypothetical protein